MIKSVYYPGDTSHPNYPIMKKQMKRGGGLISFEIDGTKEDIQRFLNNLSFLKLAVSLGDAETLIEHPATLTTALVPEGAREKMGISNQLIRLDVAVEA